MSKRTTIWLFVAAAIALAILAVLIFGDEYGDEARAFARNLLRAL
jgi:hypothetical protein